MIGIPRLREVVYSVSRARRGGQFETLAVHTDAPAGDEPVVLSTGAVIRAVLEGRLSAADAIHRGPIRVEAGIDAKLALFNLLSAAESP